MRRLATAKMGGQKRNIMITTERSAQTVNKRSPLNKNHADIVCVLRSIRESYGLTQKDMAGFLKVTQSKVSKFESMLMTSSLKFLITYALVLGYNVVADRVTAGDEISRFEERQSEIRAQASEHTLNRIKARALTPQPIEIPESDVIKQKNRVLIDIINTKLILNADMCTNAFLQNNANRWEPDYKAIDPDELTASRLSKLLGVSVKTIRRFDNCKATLPLIFRYAEVMGMELRVEPPLIYVYNDDMGSFYIQNYIALHSARKCL